MVDLFELSTIGNTVLNARASVLLRAAFCVLAAVGVGACDSDDDVQQAMDGSRIVVVVAQDDIDDTSVSAGDAGDVSDLHDGPVVTIATVPDNDDSAATDDSTHDDADDSASVDSNIPTDAIDMPGSVPNDPMVADAPVSDDSDATSDDAVDDGDEPAGSGTVADNTEDTGADSTSDSPTPVSEPDMQADDASDSDADPPLPGDVVDNPITIVSFDGNIPAFPGAEGYGASARGGRGGMVVKVTNLNDSGPGSLRAAMMMTEPRMIVFEVSGTIELQTQIRLKAANSFFTLAGQTAPGDGIAIRNHKLVFDGVREGIVRHLRLRHGCASNCTVGVADNLTLLGNTELMIFDHLSMTWAEDEVMDVWGDNIRDITFQWSMMGEGTVFCIEGASQNLGPLIGGGDGIRNVTFANNFVAHTCFRNFMQSAGHVSFLNNMSYNTFKLDYSFSLHPRSTEQIRADIIGHYFREGPQTDRRKLIDVINAVGSETRQPVSLHIRDLAPFTVSGDVHPFFVDDPYSLVSTRSIGSDVLPEWQARDQPLAAPRFPVQLVPSLDVPSKILGSVGASLPQRDEVDQRLVESFHSLGGWESINLRQYPVLQTYDLRIDTDDDGMPDDWETRHGLDPLNAADHAGDIDNDGYSNLENFINSL